MSPRYSALVEGPGGEEGGGYVTEPHIEMKVLKLFFLNPKLMFKPVPSRALVATPLKATFGVEPTRK